MSALADIAKSDGVIAAVRTTCDHMDDAGGCERAGDGPWCDLLRPWIGACAAVGRGATIMLDDGPAIRVRMSGTDVVAVAFVPGHKVVKSLSRMMRRVFKTKPSPAKAAADALSATMIADGASSEIAKAGVQAFISALKTGRDDAPVRPAPAMVVDVVSTVTGPVPPGVVLW